MTPARVRLLLALQEHDSISTAARAVKMSYKGAWDAIAALNTFTTRPLVQTELGGAGGGAVRLTPTGLRLLAFYQALEALQYRVLAGVSDGDFNQLLQRVNNLMLRTSARNRYEGVVAAVQRGAVNSQIITNDSIEDMGVVEGMAMSAIIKASHVMLAVAV